MQRSLTKNYESITDYILSQKEHFFNALVLAVYDGDPVWNEIEVGFKGEDYYNMGFLYELESQLETMKDEERSNWFS